MKKDNFYILTGGPGSGKTSVLDMLNARGIATVPEVARVIIEDQKQKNGRATHDGDQVAFRDLMFEASFKDYCAFQDKNELVVFDRGIPDVIGYSDLINVPVPKKIEEAAKAYRYNKTVFIFPPWEAIYQNDRLRKQDFQEAVKTYDAIFHAYERLGYNLVLVPKVSVAERVEFLMSSFS